MKRGHEPMVRFPRDKWSGSFFSPAPRTANPPPPPHHPRLACTTSITFCKTQTSGRGEQSWNQARGRKRKNVCLLPVLQLPGRTRVLLGWGWGAGGEHSQALGSLELVFPTCSWSGPASVPHQAALIASIGQQLANSCFIRIIQRAC